MNRIALHQSTIHPLDPVALVGVAQRAGLDSIGLRVAAAADVERWWSRGIGSPMLRDLVAALLAARVTVLDVGRIPLGPELCVVDIAHPYGRVLELGTRLGAQFVTVRAGEPGDDPVELFARLAELSARYHLRPLLSPAAGTAISSLEQAVAVIEGTDGGVVLDVVPGRDRPERIDETVVELGERLGYVRVPARDAGHDRRARPARHAPAAGSRGDRRRTGDRSRHRRGTAGRRARRGPRPPGDPSRRPARRGRRAPAPPARRACLRKRVRRIDAAAKQGADP